MPHGDRVVVGKEVEGVSALKVFHGLDSAALDDVFELLAWNQGIGYFSSEIGPSTLFAAYKSIKAMEKQGRDRSEICGMLKEKFGEKNPDVKV